MKSKIWEFIEASNEIPNVIPYFSTCSEYLASYLTDLLIGFNVNTDNEIKFLPTNLRSKKNMTDFFLD